MRTFTKHILASALLLLGAVSGAKAQIVPANPGGMEYPYPAAVLPSTNTPYTSCFSLDANFSSPTNYNVLVSSWENSTGAGIIWQVVDYTTSTVLDKGFQLYPAGTSHINVGIVRMGPNPQIDVSYHKFGTGHFVDVYNWNTPLFLGGPGGITALFSKQLSCIPNSTNIAMDSHIGYGTAIVWEDPANGINVIAANMNSFGPIFTCMGTASHVTPDVSFAHYAGPLEIHIASYLAGTGIQEYYLNWMDIIPGGIFAMGCVGMPLCVTCAVPVTFQDTNPITATPNHIEICTKDHYTVGNWAYVYNIGSDIFARIYNANFSPFPAPVSLGFGTVCFTNGSYVPPVYPPSLPIINTAANDMPTIAWLGQGPGAPPQFYVGWHTAFRFPAYNPTSDAYIAILVNEDGMLVGPAPAMGNFYGAALTPTDISPEPAIAFSRNDDMNSMMYETFSQANPTMGYWMEHRWIAWGGPSFRPALGSAPVTEDKHISINPNPFKDDLKLTFSYSMENEVVAIRVTDMAGRDMGIYNNMLMGANDFLSQTAKKLIPGTYIIDVLCKSSNVQQSFKVIKE